MKNKVIIGIAAAVVVGLAIVYGICFDGFQNMKTSLIHSNDTNIDCRFGPGTQEAADGYSFEQDGAEVDFSEQRDI